MIHTIKKIIDSEEFYNKILDSFSKTKINGKEMLDLFFRVIEELSDLRLSKNDKKEFILNDYFGDGCYENLSEITGGFSENIDSAIVCIQNKDIDGLNKVKNDFNEMKKKIEELENELYVDELTGIHNRKYLNSKIIEDNKIKEEGEFFIIDLNDFKFINDTYGHIIGDKTLQIFTSTLKNKFDKISKEIEFIRFAGDEFIIISPIHYSNSVVSILEEVKELFNKRHIKVKDKLNSSFQIKFSYGNKKFEKNESYEEIFNKTDKKMYENKTKDKKLK